MKNLISLKYGGIFLLYPIYIMLYILNCWKPVEDSAMPSYLLLFNLTVNLHLDLYWLLTSKFVLSFDTATRSTIWVLFLSICVQLNIQREYISSLYYLYICIYNMLYLLIRSRNPWPFGFSCYKIISRKLIDRQGLSRVGN